MAVVSQLPGKLDLHVVRGDDAAVQLTFKDDAAAVIDMSGRTLTSKLLLATGTDLSGGALTLDTTDAATGVVVVPLPDTLTTSLTGEVYRWVLRDDSNDRVLLGGFVRVYAPGSAGVATGSTAVTVTVTNSTAAVTVTAAVVGAAGADGSDGLDQAAVDARISAASIDGSQIQSGTVPDAHIPAAIARDSEVTAAIAAAKPDHVYTSAAPINVPLTGTNAAIGGFLTGDVEVFLSAQTDPDENNRGYHYDFETDTLTPDGFVVDAAHGGQTVVIVADGTTSKVKPDGAGGWELVHLTFSDDLDALSTTLGAADVAASRVTLDNVGLFGNGQTLSNLEAFLDRKRMCNHVVPASIDLPTLVAGPVASEDQPNDILGNIVTGRRIVILGTGVSEEWAGHPELDGAWYAEKDDATGQWTVMNYPVRAYDDTPQASTNPLVAGCTGHAPGVFVIYDNGSSLVASFGADFETQAGGQWFIVKGAA